MRNLMASVAGDTGDRLFCNPLAYVQEVFEGRKVPARTRKDS